MKKNVLQDFIKKHTDVIEKCRWVSNAKNKTLKVDVAADTKNLLCDLTLNNWDGFGDAEVGVGNLPKFKRELNGLTGEDLTAVVNYNDDKSRIINIDFLDGENVGTLTVSDLDMIAASSKLKTVPPFNAEIIFDKDLVERFLKAKSALPDVKTFTVMMNKKGVLGLVVGFSNINSSRFSLKVNTTDGLDKVDEPLHFRADYLQQILAANSECNDSILKVSDGGFCSISFVSGDFISNYYLTTTDDQD
jgi:hypothetical protein